MAVLHGVEDLVEVGAVKGRVDGEGGVDEEGTEEVVNKRGRVGGRVSVEVGELEGWGAEGVEKVWLREDDAGAVGGAEFMVFARCLCLVSASRLSSRVSKNEQVLASKSRNAFPKRSVKESKMPKDKSVCWRSFANPCQ